MRSVWSGALWLVVVLGSACWPAPAWAAAAFRAYVTTAEGVVVIDTASNAVVSVIPLPFATRGIAVTQDGARAYVSGDGGVIVINTAAHSIVTSMDTPAVGDRGDVALTPDGLFAYVVTRDGVAIISTETNSVAATIDLPCTQLNIAFSPDGARAYISGFPSCVSVIDTATHALIAEIGLLAGSAGGIAVSPDGRLAYAAVDEFGGFLNIIDTASNKVLTAFGLGNHLPGDIVVSQNGGRLYVTGDPTVVFDTAARRTVSRIPIRSRRGLALMPDGKLLYVAEYLGAVDSNTVHVVATSSNQVVKTIRVGERPNSIVIGVAPVQPPTVTPTATSTVAPTATRTHAAPEDNRGGCSLRGSTPPTGGFTPFAISVGILLLLWGLHMCRRAGSGPSARSGAVMMLVRTVFICALATAVVGGTPAALLSQEGLRILSATGTEGDGRVAARAEAASLAALQRARFASIAGFPLRDREAVALHLERFNPVAADATMRVLEPAARSGAFPLRPRPDTGR